MYKRRKRRVATIEVLRRWLRYWQKLLSLQDWEIVVRICAPDDMDNKEVQGEVEYQAHKKAAVVRLLDPRDYPPNPSWPQDMERTLVHELVHLHFAEKTTDEKLTGPVFDLVEERVVNATSQALVDLRRSI